MDFGIEEGSTGMVITRQSMEIHTTGNGTIIFAMAWASTRGGRRAILMTGCGRMVSSMALERRSGSKGVSGVVDL